MGKKQQIEELAREIEKRLECAKSVVGSMNKGIGYWIAEDLVDKNYRKITPNVDFVVKAGELSTIQMNARKETAKEIFYKAERKSYFQDGGHYGKDRHLIDIEELKQIIKNEYGVEIDE